MENFTLELVAFGNCAVDYILAVDRFPDINGKCSSRNLTVMNGGQGSNIAWAAARLGIKSALISKVADDENGNVLLKELKEIGVITDGVVKQVGGHTPLTIIIADLSTSSRTCVNYKLGIKPLDTNEINIDLCQRTRLFVSDTRSPDESIYCSKIVRRSGGKVVVVMEHMNEKSIQLGSLADVVICSMSFIQRYLPRQEDASMIIDFAGSMKVDNLIATLGEDGCLLFSKGRVKLIKGFTVKAIDTVGAGDAFAAGVCFGILKNWTLYDSCIFGNFLGARACEGEGARSNTVPSSSYIPHLLNELGIGKR